MSCTPAVLVSETSCYVVEVCTPGPQGPAGPAGSPVGLNSISAAVSGTLNNWSPQGYVPSSTNRLIIVPVSSATLTGLEAASDGWQIRIFNASSSVTLNFAHLTASAFGNQFYCPGGTTVMLPPFAGAVIEYVSSLSSWVFVSMSVVPYLAL